MFESKYRTESSPVILVSWQTRHVILVPRIMGKKKNVDINNFPVMFLQELVARGLLLRTLGNDI